MQRKPSRLVSGAIWYHTQSQQLRIIGDRKRNLYIRHALEPDVVPCLQRLAGAVFQKNRARLHIAKNGQNFFSAQRLQHQPWPAYSLNMPIF